MISHSNGSSNFLPRAALSGWGDLTREMDRLFSDFERGWMVAPSARTARAVPPTSGAVRLEDRGDELVLSVDLPGVAESDVDLQIEGDVLTLRAHRKPDLPEGFGRRVSERPELKVEQRCQLPCPIDVDGVRASMTNGVLEVFLPRAPEARPRRIPVTSLEPGSSTKAS
jgi:HSP20 family protein